MLGVLRFSLNLSLFHNVVKTLQIQLDFGNCEFIRGNFSGLFVTTTASRSSSSSSNGSCRHSASRSARLKSVH